MVDQIKTSSNKLDEESNSEIKQLTNDSKEKSDDKSISRRLKINYTCICLFAFLLGSDFAVIIPTLWDRLSTDYNASGAFMGLVISSYSLSGVFCGLIMGKLSDTVNKTKSFYLICMVFSILGHLFYFVGINKYGILAARSVSGLCLGASPVALAYIAKSTNEKQRIGIIAIVMASRQLGLMFGPAFNIFLRKTNYLLFNTFLIDRKSSPGLFMAFLWLFCFLLVFLFYKDTFIKAKSPEKQKIEEKKIINYKKDFLRIEIFVLLAVTFFTYFNQTSLETILIPFTELMFGWNELENSILFCIGGSCIIISYILIKILSIKLKDRMILLLGVTVIFLGLCIGCSALPFAKLPIQANQTMNYPSEFNLTSNLVNSTLNKQDNSNQTKSILIHDYTFFPSFVVFVLFDVVGLPAIATCSASLFTKLLRYEAQGFGQGKD